MLTSDVSTATGDRLH